MYTVIQIVFNAPDFEYHIIKSNLPTKEDGDNWITQNIKKIDEKTYWVIHTKDIMKFSGKVKFGRPNTPQP